jgi:hypothetical protein
MIKRGILRREKREREKEMDSKLAATTSRPKPRKQTHLHSITTRNSPIQSS